MTLKCENLQRAMLNDRLLITSSSSADESCVSSTRGSDDREIRPVWVSFVIAFGLE